MSAVIVRRNIDGTYDGALLKECTAESRLRNQRLLLDHFLYSRQVDMLIDMGDVEGFDDLMLEYNTELFQTIWCVRRTGGQPTRKAASLEDVCNHYHTRIGWVWDSEEHHWSFFDLDSGTFENLSLFPP